MELDLPDSIASKSYAHMVGTCNVLFCLWHDARLAVINPVVREREMTRWSCRPCTASATARRRGITRSCTSRVLKIENPNVQLSLAVGRQLVPPEGHQDMYKNKK
jgi:hypothetical protein